MKTHNTISSSTTEKEYLSIPSTVGSITKIKRTDEKHRNKGVAISERSSRIQSYVSILLGVHPYPIDWYVTLSDIQITRVYGVYLNKLVKASILADELEVANRVASSVKTGVYRLLARNKCSLRFSYMSTEGKVVYGIIASYETKGFELSIHRRLSSNEMCIAWQTGKVEVIDRSLLISKILSTSADDPQALIKAIHALERTK